MTPSARFPFQRSAAHRPLLLAVLMGPVSWQPAAAAETTPESLDEIVIVAPYGLSLARDRVPAQVQSADAARIEALQPLDLSDLLNRGFGSVSINHAQNNPLQPDVNFRGFTASPLLGLPQGLSVYANGVRMNETFGDTVNWDLLPVSAIHSVQLVAGPSPVFGLNTLGGALALQLKDGFSFEGTQAESYFGSFGRIGASLQHGGNNGSWGYYGNIDYFEEDGWRDFSPSDSLRLHGALSHRGEGTSFDLAVSHADSNLRGNGASPAELLEIDRRQVFTHPDITENRLTQVIATGSHEMTAALTLSGNAFFRNLRTDTFNGDGTIFEECTFGDDEFLVEEDFTDVNEDGACSDADDADIALVFDPVGDPIEAEIGGVELNAINNIGRRKQQSHGGSMQLTHSIELAGDRRNDFITGAAFSRGESSFNSVVEVAALADDRSTTRTGILADEFRTAVDSNVTTWSLYAADTLDLTDRLAVTLAGRFDHSRITLADRSGQSPELNGRHKFGRFNPSAGLTFRARPDLLLYASLSQASRTPTAVELACADEDAPCSLPNAFLADPPLDEVVARSFELGARGLAAHGLRWHLGAFQTTNQDDILFQTVGGAQANIGFFANVSDTRRRGIEVELKQQLGALGWSLDYALVDATFEDEFVVNSPNHPLFGDDAADVDGADRIVGEEKLLVGAGSTIPGIARHQANLSLDLRASQRLRIGTDLSWRSGVYLRGDEINVLGKTPSYLLVSLRGDLRINDSVTAFARIENLFNRKYETFGLLGEPDEVFATFEEPEFYGAGPPRGAWLGVRVSL
jgi:outer membrane receptor protein involved in Fe transport